MEMEHAIHQLQQQMQALMTEMQRLSNENEQLRRQAAAASSASGRGSGVPSVVQMPPEFLKAMNDMVGKMTEMNAKLR